MKKKVLIIEDDESISEVLEYIVHELGCDAMTSTYALPVRQIANLAPNLILLDHWLGDSLGGELCSKLKSNLSTKTIPVLIVSADLSAQQIAKDAHADDFLNKPFQVEDIEEKIRKFIITDGFANPPIAV